MASTIKKELTRYLTRSQSTVDKIQEETKLRLRFRNYGVLYNYADDHGIPIVVQDGKQIRCRKISKQTI